MREAPCCMTSPWNSAYLRPRMNAFSQPIVGVDFTCLLSATMAKYSTSNISTLLCVVETQNTFTLKTHKNIETVFLPRSIPHLFCASLGTFDVSIQIAKFWILLSPRTENAVLSERVFRQWALGIGAVCSLNGKPVVVELYSGTRSGRASSSRFWLRQMQISPKFERLADI